MKRFPILLVLALTIVGAALPASAVKVLDPTPNRMFSDEDGNNGYLEVAAEDGALLRACNENAETPAGDDATGYVWVNPEGESTPAAYGNQTVGAADADGADDGPPRDGDGETQDDCRGNEDHPTS